MKYVKTSLFTKLISLLTVLVLTVTLCACGGETENGSSVPPVESSEPEVVKLSLEEALELVERDREITEMFICNSLCGEIDEAKPTALPKGHKYADFSEIESLIDKTYLSTSKEKEFFLTYPNEANRSVYAHEGVTYVFKHSGSEFYDFIDVETVEVVSNDKPFRCCIKAVTETGFNVELYASYVNEAWYLEQGIYFTREPVYSTFDEKYVLSDIGSLSDFCGNILVVECYISDSVTSFTTASEEIMHKNIEAAVGYLAAESNRMGNTVNVDYKSAYFHHGGIIDNALDFDIFFAETGFGTLQSFAETEYELANYDNYFFIVCFDKPFESESTAFDGANEEVRYGERVIASVETDSTQICKLVLELLGVKNVPAEESDEYIRSLYSYYFPDDFHVKDTLEETSISPVTAYFCGMTSDLDPLYRVFYIDK